MAPHEKYCERLYDTSLTHQERFTIGQSLAKIGDTRPGVGLDLDNLPNIMWIEIAGGQVKFEWDNSVFKVNPFRLAKYPVTNEQFEAFLKAEDGYRNEEWWRDIEQSCEAGQPRWQEANTPRVTVSWYEAVAFCRWLSAKTGSSIPLPTEWEWQQAATSGDPKHEYPWKGSWDATRCNNNESRLNRTTVVGMYPQGATQQGGLDMAGNVWEWCSNIYYRPDTKITIGGLRVIRGGSWDDKQERLRTSSRDGFSVFNRLDSIGFRLVQDIL